MTAAVYNLRYPDPPWFIEPAWFLPSASGWIWREQRFLLVRFNPSMVSPVIVGRDELVRSLEHLVEQTASGIRQTVLLTGEAGVGKTRLVTETESTARRRGLLVMQGNCFESDQSFPYAPFIDLLRRYVVQHPAEDLVSYFGADGPEIGKLLPDLVPLLPDLAPTTILGSGQDKRRLFQSLVHFITRLTAAQPLLLILEDLHWSDDSSLEFLLYLIRHTVEHPILLVLTCRSDETHPGLRHLLAELDRERLAIELLVAPLSLAQVDALLRVVFRLDRPVRPEFRDELYALTEGNPFFIEEVCKSLVASGDIFYSGGAWDRRPLEELHIPRTIQDAVQRRLDQLGEAARHVATWAAVVGARFAFALLRELANMNEAELLQQIKELMAAQLVVEESAEQFAFRHALTREAVYATLLLRERKSLHRLVADTLERRVPGVGIAPTADLAYHYYAAEAWDKAYQYSQRAGEEALALYAPREAIQHFTHAIEASAQLATATPAPFEGGKSSLGALYRQRGQAYEITGDFERAEGDYEWALSAARDGAQRSSASLPPNPIDDIRASEPQDTTTEWQCLIDLGFLWAARDYQRTGDYFRRALELAELSGDKKLRAHSHNH
jgi:predicted ATPase